MTRAAQRDESRNSQRTAETIRSGIAALVEHAHLVRASFGVMTSTTITSFSGWLFWLVATHHWRTSQVGVSTSLVAAMTVISLIAAQPVSTTLLARLPRSEHPKSILAASCAFSGTISLVLSVIAIIFLPSSLSVVRDVAVAVPFSAGCVTVAIGVVLDAASIAARRPTVMITRNGTFGIGKLLVLVAVAVLVPSVSGPRAVIASWTGTCIVACAISWYILRRSDILNRSRTSALSATRHGWAQVRTGLVSQTLGSWGGSLPPQLLPVLVAAILGATATGYFSITWLLGGLCFMISPAVSQALLAEASHHPEQLREKTRLAAVVSLSILAVPLLVYVVASRPVLTLFGARYAQSGHFLLVILAISAIPDLITNIAVARYRSMERLRLAACVNVTIATVTIVGTGLFLRRFGIDAAGWSWTAGQVAGCLVVAGEAFSAHRRSPAVALTT